MCGGILSHDDSHVCFSRHFLLSSERNKSLRLTGLFSRPTYMVTVFPSPNIFHQIWSHGFRLNTEGQVYMLQQAILALLNDRCISVLFSNVWASTPLFLQVSGSFKSKSPSGSLVVDVFAICAMLFWFRNSTFSKQCTFISSSFGIAYFCT